MMRRTAATLVLLAMTGLGTSAQTAQAPQPSTLDERDARSLNLTAYAELLRSDVRAEKVAILTEVMEFTEAEDKAFWPIYREYDFELSKVNDERIAGIETYAKSYTRLSPALANELAMKALDVEGRRLALKRTYYTKLAAAVSPLTAAKALQMENQIQLIVDLQVAASLPVLK